MMDKTDPEAVRGAIAWATDPRTLSRPKNISILAEALLEREAENAALKARLEKAGEILNREYGLTDSVAAYREHPEKKI